MSTLTYEDRGFRVSVEFDRYDAWNHAPAYRWTVVAGDITATADDLRLGGDSEPDDCAALRSLLVFLGSALETYERGDRAGWTLPESCDGFPTDLLAVLSSAESGLIDMATMALGGES